MGPPSTVSQKAFHGYYDGHKVTYLSTDVSSKVQAAAMHVNQINQLERKGMLTEKSANVVLNCPIIKVGS